MTVNTRGDRMTREELDMVMDPSKVAGRRIMDIAKEFDPEGAMLVAQGRVTLAKPGPEDVLLLYIYQCGALNPDKAISVPDGNENETHMLYLYADDYVGHAGDKIYVTALGIRRLQGIGVIDKKGKVVSFKEGGDD